MRIVFSLSGVRKTVSAVVEEMGLSQAPVFHQPGELRRLPPADVERKGLFVCHEPADKGLFEAVFGPQECRRTVSPEEAETGERDVTNRHAVTRPIRGRRARR